MRRRVLLLAAPALMAPRLARAVWPDRPIRLIVPFPAGGGVDLTARLLGEAMERSLGQPVVVENRSGAGGAIGVQAAAQAAPDGDTLAMTSPSTVTIGPQLRPTAYDPFALTHISRVCTSPLLLICRPGLPVKDFAGFVVLARRNPGGLRLANAGLGTVTQFSAELFNLKLGVGRFLHVSYRGTAPAVGDVIAGNADAFFSDSSAWSNVEQGQVRLLAVTSPQRWARSPATPTVAESIPGFQAVNWYGMAGPGGMPAPVTERLAAETANALGGAAVRRRLSDIGFDAAPLPGAEFAALLRQEARTWGDLIKAANIKVE